MIRASEHHQRQVDESGVDEQAQDNGERKNHDRADNSHDAAANRGAEVRAPGTARLPTTPCSALWKIAEMTPPIMPPTMAKPIGIPIPPSRRMSEKSTAVDP